MSRLYFVRSKTYSIFGSFTNVLQPISPANMKLSLVLVIAAAVHKRKIATSRSEIAFPSITKSVAKANWAVMCPPVAEIVLCSAHLLLFSQSEAPSQTTLTTRYFLTPTVKMKWLVCQRTALVDLVAVVMFLLATMHFPFSLHSPWFVLIRNVYSEVVYLPVVYIRYIVWKVFVVLCFPIWEFSP